MGAKTLISPEEYLSTYYEHEPEYVRGELRERPLPNRTHAKTIKRIMALLDRVMESRGFSAESEVRCRTPNGNVRLPDVALFLPDTPEHGIVTAAPLVVVEVLSEEEKYNALLDKLCDYEAWPVPHIWIVNPRFGTLQVFDAGSLRRVEAFTLPEYGIEIRYSDLVG